MKRILILLVTALLLTGCIGDRWARKTILEERDVKVYLEQRIEDDLVIDQGYAHPATLDPRALAFVLEKLEYASSRLFRDPEPQPVFFRREAHALATPLAEALKQADATQRVRFTSFNMGGGLLFSARRRTEGVVFLEAGNRLNIAFLLINDELHMDDDPAHASPRIYGNPLAITSSHSPLLPKSWFTLRPREGDEEPHPMWAVVSLDEMKEALPVADTRPGGPGGKDQAAVTPEGSKQETVPSGKQAEAESARIKEKLKLLKELFEENLIDEEEYEAGKKKLLEELSKKK
jgi:hypothetical protein